jgi:hypothetical protein
LADTLNDASGRTHNFTFDLSRDVLSALGNGQLLYITGALGVRFRLTGIAPAIAALARCGDAIADKATTPFGPQAFTPKPPSAPAAVASGQAPIVKHKGGNLYVIGNLSRHARCRKQASTVSGCCWGCGV